MNDINIKVEPKHIEKGIRCDAGHCAVALAVLDQCDFNKITVSANVVYAKKDGVWYEFVPSDKTRLFIRNFDGYGGNEPKPGRYSLIFRSKCNW